MANLVAAAVAAGTLAVLFLLVRRDGTSLNGRGWARVVSLVVPNVMWAAVMGFNVIWAAALYMGEVLLLVLLSLGHPARLLTNGYLTGEPRTAGLPAYLERMRSRSPARQAMTGVIVGLTTAILVMLMVTIMVLSKG